MGEGGEAVRSPQPPKVSLKKPVFGCKKPTFSVKSDTLSPKCTKGWAKYDKVNRCLARYSPRATTTNRPTNRAPNKPAFCCHQKVTYALSGGLHCTAGIEAKSGH